MGEIAKVARYWERGKNARKTLWGLDEKPIKREIIGEMGSPENL